MKINQQQKEKGMQEKLDKAKGTAVHWSEELEVMNHLGESRADSRLSVSWVGPQVISLYNMKSATVAIPKPNCHCRDAPEEGSAANTPFSVGMGCQILEHDRNLILAFIA